jgi:UDP-N-acetylmuramoyl-tripeptide--D-alanyl-D-alanine ligase
MGEVGDQGPAFHEEWGPIAQERGIAYLWTAGSLGAFAASAFGCAPHLRPRPMLVAALPQRPQAGSVLVKGSRFMKMEQWSRRSPAPRASMKSNDIRPQAVAQRSRDASRPRPMAADALAEHWASCASSSTSPSAP